MDGLEHAYSGRDCAPHLKVSIAPARGLDDIWAMRRRLTVRVLLLDPADRLLLMKGRLPGNPPGSAWWYTVGGGAEPGEGVVEAALREIGEETGFTEIELGPVVWRREGIWTLVDGERIRADERYLVARCPGGEPSREGWLDYERELNEDLRWWTLAELAATTEPVFPPDLAELLPDVLAGLYPDPPRRLPWD
jgi:8-oxo-dGTP pyrophosphatase MutT (NUDIX family)